LCSVVNLRVAKYGNSTTKAAAVEQGAARRLFVKWKRDRYSDGNAEVQVLGLPNKGTTEELRIKQRRQGAFGWFFLRERRRRRRHGGTSACSAMFVLKTGADYSHIGTRSKSRDKAANPKRHRQHLRGGRPIPVPKPPPAQAQTTHAVGTVAGLNQEHNEFKSPKCRTAPAGK